MNVRDWLNQNSALTTMAAVVILICALGFAMCHLTKSRGVGSSIGETYYYDLVEGKVFGGPMLDVLPPIDAPSGPISHGGQEKQAGLRAYIFDCGGCSTDYLDMTPQEVEEAGGRIAYLEMFSQKSLDAYREFVDGKIAGQPQYNDLNQIWAIIEEGKYMAQVPDEVGTYPKLSKAASKKGKGYAAAAMKLCPNGHLPRNCMPNQ